MENHFRHNSEKYFWKFEDDYGVSIVGLSNTWAGYSAEKYFGTFEKYFWKFENYFWKFKNYFWKFEKYFWKFEKYFWKFEDDYGVSIVGLGNTWLGYSAPFNNSGGRDG